VLRELRGAEHAPPVIVHTSQVLDEAAERELLEDAVAILPKAPGPREREAARLEDALARAGLGAGR
jgi:hypothetical protein